jgi:hypothetical protein
MPIPKTSTPASSAIEATLKLGALLLGALVAVAVDFVVDLRLILAESIFQYS